MLYEVITLGVTMKSAQYSVRSPKYKTKAPKSQIEFISDLDPELPQIVADPDQLQQIFLNLILNAVDSLYTLSA